MEELFEQHSEKLFTYLRQHTQSREDAEDILVETFMAALGETKFAHLSETAQIAWLWRVARNKVVLDLIPTGNGLRPSESQLANGLRPSFAQASCKECASLSRSEK